MFVLCIVPFTCKRRSFYSRPTAVVVTELSVSVLSFVLKSKGVWRVLETPSVLTCQLEDGP